MLANKHIAVKSNLYNRFVILPNFSEETKLWNKGNKYIIGVDEVGRGAFAGPVTVAAVVFKSETGEINGFGINDSKLLKPSAREKLSELIKNTCASYSIATVGVPIINRVGIGKATRIAFRKAIASIMYKVESSKYKKDKDTKYILSNTKYYLLVDGFHIKYVKRIGLKNQKAIIKGDRISISIAAASIIAKVERDELMRKLSKRYPQYGFGKHKGYGTKAHQAAIKKHGLSKLHRKSFNLTKFT